MWSVEVRCHHALLNIMDLFPSDETKLEVGGLGDIERMGKIGLKIVDGEGT